MVISHDTTDRDSPQMPVRNDDLCRIIGLLTAENLKTVSEIAHKLLILQNLQNPDAKTLEDINLVEYIGPWIDHLRAEGKSPETIRTYSHYVTALLAAFPQPSSILIEAYLITKSPGGIPPPSTQGRIKSYKSFFSFLVRRSILIDNPAEHLEYPKLPQRIRTSPTEGTIHALIDLKTVLTRDRAILLILAGCGLRATELLTLRTSDIDMVRFELTVIGKGNKQRPVPMPPETAEAVLLQMTSIPPDSKWLFPGRFPPKSLNLSTLEDILADLCHRSGVEVLTAHAFRHYYASSLLNSGVDLRTVSELLGHSDPSTTARIYWHQTVAGKHHQAIKDHNPLKGLTASQAKTEEELE